jgi:hypothetical protein
MAAELADRLAMLVAVRRLPCMSVADSRSLRSDSYVRMQHFVELLLFLFGFLWGCAARIHAISLCYSSWYFGFLSPRRFAGGQ